MIRNVVPHLSENRILDFSQMIDAVDLIDTLYKCDHVQYIMQIYCSNSSFRHVIHDTIFEQFF